MSTASKGRRRSYTNAEKARFAEQREADLKQTHELLTKKLGTLSNSDDLNNQLLVMPQTGVNSAAVVGKGRGRRWVARSATKRGVSTTSKKVGWHEDAPGPC